jgi:hypothetical protein
MIGIASTFRAISSNTETIRKVNLSLLSLHRKDLNFSAKNSIRDTSNKENTIVIVVNTQGVYNHVPTLE